MMTSFMENQDEKQYLLYDSIIFLKFMLEADN